MPATLTCADFLPAPRSSAPTRIKSSLSPEHGRHFGPGLIGGSLALALRELRPEWNLRIWARSESPRKGAQVLSLRVSWTRSRPSSGANLCVLCTPISAMAFLARNRAGTFRWRDGYGRRKRQGGVVQQLETILGGQVHWFSSDGRIGTERIRRRTCKSFPKGRLHYHPDGELLARVHENSLKLWEGVGCRLVEMPTEEHDECVARVSHLPHAVAAALVNSISLRDPNAGALGAVDTETPRVSPPRRRYVAGDSSRNRRTGCGVGGFFDRARQDEANDPFQDAAALESFLEHAKSIRENLRHEHGRLARHGRAQNWRPKSPCQATRASPIAPSCSQRFQTAYAGSRIFSMGTTVCARRGVPATRV